MSTTMKRLLTSAFAISMTVGAAACSSSSGSAAEPADTTPDETTAASSTTEVEVDENPIFEVLPTEPTEPGPRPELAWPAVDGASTYDLIVLDAAGEPYWGWQGTETSVFLGGLENPDAVGAWVFEPLTWIVTARDADGQPLAMSAKAELLP